MYRLCELMTGIPQHAKSTLSITVQELWNRYALNIFARVFERAKGQQQDISKVTASEIAVLGASVWLLSPSCQPYTDLNRNKKESLDPRAASFLHLMGSVLQDLVHSCSQPRFVFVENVPGFKARLYHRMIRTLPVLIVLTGLQFTTISYWPPSKPWVSDTGISTKSAAIRYSELTSKVLSTGFFKTPLILGYAGR